jgi:hypothetical protein
MFPEVDNAMVFPELSRAIVAPHDVVLNTRDAQRLALMFDRILLYPRSRRQYSSDETTRQIDETDFLVNERVATRLAWSMPFAIGRSDGSMLRTDDDSEIALPFDLLTACVSGESNGADDLDSLLQSVASNLTFNHCPVTAHVEMPGRQAAEASSSNCMQIVVERVPMPPEGIPWQDLMQFRNDEETRSSLRELRLWMQKQALARTPALIALEELEALIEKYRKYMKLQHRKYGEGALGTLLVCLPDALEQALNVRLGSAIRALVDVRARHLALQEAELQAPGREVSYFTRIDSLLRDT